MAVEFSKNPVPSSPNMHGVFRKLDPHAKFLQPRSFFEFRAADRGLLDEESSGDLGCRGFVVCILLWRVFFGIASTFVGFSEGMAKYGFLALSSAMVAFAVSCSLLVLVFLVSLGCVHFVAKSIEQFSAGFVADVFLLPWCLFASFLTSFGFSFLLVLSSKLARGACTFMQNSLSIQIKFTEMAMRKLNTSASVLEVMGAPLTGTDLRAYVMSEGGITLQKFQTEVKKQKYDMRLLAVDIPMASGPDQRLFLIGDNEEYKIGGGLISELRNPVVKALAAAKEFEARDDKEDAARELQEAGKKHQVDIQKLGKGNFRWLQGRFF
ncbi:hypothetical protein Sango_2803800 [Sesamum angolense]|uniref:Uncharacterized protein n=1 Tax=Sesamum angolense TaxID=2727404 RepID=A0AAE1VWV5_9LAMI|nr:hypothetical protein Sango_2803800 [Sesamum angolense]